MVCFQCHGNYFVVVLCAFMAIDNRGARVTIFDVNVGK